MLLRAETELTLHGRFHMASCSSSSWVCFVTVLLHVAAWSIPMPTASSTSTRCYKTIYSFGDSLADTGNSYYDPDAPPSQSLALNPPYGETYFHHPTGRWSDGRLVIDFFGNNRVFSLSLTLSLMFMFHCFFVALILFCFW